MIHQLSQLLHVYSRCIVMIDKRDWSVSTYTGNPSNGVVLQNPSDVVTTRHRPDEVFICDGNQLYAVGAGKLLLCHDVCVRLTLFINMVT